jgi:molecular chaperone HtpG
MEMEKIKFQVETTRILEILSSEIYDSPYALLRENIQNAYDAILMRITEESLGYDEGLIVVNIGDSEIEIIDNGIGMNESELRKNFWEAGASGKKTPLALSSGVIGTFGIGAMANFGVCSRLLVETRSIDSEETLISIAERDKLSISEECIDLNKEKDGRQPGTKIIATLDDASKITFQGAIDYLEPYIKYLPIKVVVNGILQSQKKYREDLIPDIKELHACPIKRINSGDYEANVEIMFDRRTARVHVILSDIAHQGEGIQGEAILIQNYGHLMGLRSYFGLAPIPVSGIYSFGGIANLSILTPTAGREAISRESIEHVNKLIGVVEAAVSDEISETEYADRNTQFMQYVVSNHKYELASRISIEVKPEEEQVELRKIPEHCRERTTHYYTGSDPSLIKTFSSEGACLLSLSQSNPRRQIHNHFIRNVLKIEEIPDRPQRTKVFDKGKLTMGELALTIRIAVTMDEFYLIGNVEVFFAEISHGVGYQVEKQGDVIYVYLNREANSIKPIKECYKTAYEVFDGFVNDFVRVHLYPIFAEYVPSSTRDGAEALSKILKKNRELYRYELADFGPVEKLLSDFASGIIGFPEVLKQSKTIVKKQSQVVTRTQVGTIESEIPNLAVTQATDEVTFDPMPSILRLDTELQSKILTTDDRYPALNDFKMFLSLSERLFRTEYNFFLAPHTTKIIWGANRIIYFFTHASSLLTLYYDIELKEHIVGEFTGGAAFPTTTIMTKNKIYIPIPEELVPSFEIAEGDRKEFFVRYDSIG